MIIKTDDNLKIITRKIDFNLSRDDFVYLAEFLEDKEREKILKYRNFEDSIRSLYGKIILREMLNLNKVSFEYNSWGKPKLRNQDGVYFNISHSGEYVTVAISKYDVGIDIQKMDNVNLSIGSQYFSKEENKYLDFFDGIEKKSAFFKIWTLKEAYIKAKGLGLYIPLNSFVIDISESPIKIISDFDEKCKFLTQRIDENYFLSSCLLIK